MPEITKYLIEKFILNQCSKEEVDLLIAYFKNKSTEEVFPQVEEVLKQLEEKKPLLDKADAKRIYEEIVKKTQRDTFPPFPQQKILTTLAMAALLTAIVGAAFYFNLKKDQNPPVLPHSVVAISSQEDTGIQLVTEDGKIHRLPNQGEQTLMDKKGNVVSAQKDNSLTYYKDTAVEKIKYNTLMVPYGRQFRLSLADGSQVVLNAGSSLKYPVNFPTKGGREVYLSGEAFFDISKDESHPFKVHTDKFEVQVLGTQFNASSYAQESTGSVVLVEGSVHLNSINNKEKTVQLEPGQLAKLDKENTKGGFTIKEVDTDLYTAWMKGGLVFRNISFEEILKRMGRHYNVTIINNNEKIGKELFNASFGNEPIEIILNYYKEIYGINYIQKNDTITIQPKTDTMNKK